MKVKNQFDPEAAVRFLLSGQDAVPEQLTKPRLLEVIRILVKWTQGANSRAKKAEELLHGQPVWKRRYDDQKRAGEQLARERNAAEAKVEALKTQHREALMIQHDKLTAYELELVRWREESDSQFDTLNRQLDEKDDQIKLLVEQLTAALELVNCTDAVMRASVEVANAKAKARYAELKLVSLGLKVNFVDAPEAEE